MSDSRSKSISINFPPPPPPSAAPRPSSPPSSSTALYRKHSRKKSSQILVPPIQTSRKRRGSKAEADGPTSASGSASKMLSPDGTVVENRADDDDAGQEHEEEVPVLSARTVTSGATFLIIGQFFAKIVTFAVNQLLLRFVDPSLVGANAQLELLITTILYFSREAIRLASQRQSLADKGEDVYRFEGGVMHGTLSGTVQEVVNIGFIPILVGIPLAVVMSLFYYWASPLGQEYGGMAVLLFAVASVIELISEPSFLFVQLQLEFKTRASIESVAITVRCFLTFLFVLLAKQIANASASIIAFALGQLAYSSVLTGLYMTNALARSRHKQYKILKLQGVWIEAPTGQQKIYLDPETWKLAVSMWLQTFFKHCLTEGDKFLVSMLLPMDDQGVYALVVNYGSLVARLGFLPIEEALRAFFSKLLGGLGTRKQTDLNLSVNVLSTLLRAYLHLGVVAFIFGPLVAPYLLQYLVSALWRTTTASIVLATYSCYIPFLAFNGCLEAFVQSVATVEDIKNQGRIMVGFSISFAIVGYILMDLLNLGAQGLVIANMFNMGLRIAWCVNYIEGFYRQQFHGPSWQWLRPCIPSWGVVVSSVTAGLIAYQLGPVQTFIQLLKMIVLAFVILGSVLLQEKDLILQWAGHIVRRPLPTSEKTK